MGERARALLLTSEGRRVLLALYGAAGLVSFVTYWIAQGPGYALGLGVFTAIAPLWATFCLRRAWVEDGP